MLENKSYIKLKKSNEKNFGYLFSFIFFLISIYPLYFNKSINWWLLTLSLILILITIFFPKALIYPNKLWMKIGGLLNFLISPIIIFIIFVISFYPIGLIFKLLNIDLLKIKFEKNKFSYWESRKHKMESLKKLY